MIKPWEGYYTFRGPGSVASCSGMRIGKAVVSLGPTNFELTAPVIASAKAVENLLKAFHQSDDELLPPAEDAVVAWLVLRETSKRLKECAANAAKSIGGSSLTQEAACRALVDCADEFLSAAMQKSLDAKAEVLFG